MAIGDKARAAGMDLVQASDDRRQGWQEINRTRDEIATRQSQQVRNASAPNNEIFIRWDAPRGHLVARVDVTDIGHLAHTEDVRLTRTELQQQLTEAFSRIYALEVKTGIRPASEESTPVSAPASTTPEGGTANA